MPATRLAHSSQQADGLNAVNLTHFWTQVAIGAGEYRFFQSSKAQRDALCACLMTIYMKSANVCGTQQQLLGKERRERCRKMMRDGLNAFSWLARVKNVRLHDEWTALFLVTNTVINNRHLLVLMDVCIEEKHTPVSSWIVQFNFN